MNLGNAIIHLAKFGRAPHGLGKVWVVGDQHSKLRYALARRGSALLMARTEDAPDGVLGIDAESAVALKGVLESFDGPTLAAPFDGGVRLLSRETFADLRAVDHRDLPPRPSLGLAKWAVIRGKTWTTIARVAKTAAADKEDRRGLSYVKLGPTWVEATDERVVARAPSDLPWSARMLAELVPFLEPQSDVSVGDLGQGALALASSPEPELSDMILVVDGHGVHDAWFPNLEPVWMTAGAPLMSVVVNRAEATKAARAAAAGCATSVVELRFEPDGIAFGGGTARTFVKTAEPPSGPGVVMVDVGVFVASLSGLGKEVSLGYRAPDRPLEVYVGDARALIFPVVRSA